MDIQNAIITFLTLYSPAPCAKKCRSEHQTLFPLFGRVWERDYCWPLHHTVPVAHHCIILRQLLAIASSSASCWPMHHTVPVAGHCIILCQLLAIASSSASCWPLHHTVPVAGHCIILCQLLAIASYFAGCWPFDLPSAAIASPLPCYWLYTTLLASCLPCHHSTPIAPCWLSPCQLPLAGCRGRLSLQVLGPITTTPVYLEIFVVKIFSWLP